MKAISLFAGKEIAHGPYHDIGSAYLPTKVSNAKENLFMAEQQDNQTSEFVAESQVRRIGLVREIWGFLKHNKKWWLTPILLVILLMGLLVVIGGSGTAPFIYALF